MKYKLIIFDFDGTLADTYDFFISALNEIADKHKFKKISAHQWELIKDYDAKRIFEHLNVPIWKIPIVISQVRTFMSKNINKISLFDGIDNLLINLSNKNIKLAVVTSNSYQNVCQVLGSKSSIINYFECNVSVSGKPARIRKILNQSRIPDENSIYIGDEIRDVKAAKKANIAFGGVSWGYNSAESLKEFSPQKMFANINDILENLPN